MLTGIILILGGLLFFGLIVFLLKLLWLVLGLVLFPLKIVLAVLGAIGALVLIALLFPFVAGLAALFLPLALLSGLVLFAAVITGAALVFKAIF